MFSITEPYAQQMSFMFVAMPSVLAIIKHYTDRPTAALDEERTASLATHTRKYVLIPHNTPSPHDADTSQHPTP
jgi:hypothetical protein